MVALVLASEALRKFGGDSLGEFVRNHAGYLASARREHAASERHLVLIGLMGAGKTTVGRALRRRGSSAPFVDTDDLVEAATGMRGGRDVRDARARRASASCERRRGRRRVRVAGADA